MHVYSQDIVRRALGHIIMLYSLYQGPLLYQTKARGSQTVFPAW